MVHHDQEKSVAAVILAAGMSRRMGRPKMVMPWGETTIIGQVVQTLLKISIKPLVVVTGGSHELVESALQDMPVTLVFNPQYSIDQMVISLQAGLRKLDETVQAAMVVLGDQPQIEPSVIQAVIHEYECVQTGLVIPSYQMHRGHPWIVDRSLWPAIFALQPPATLRDFLQAHQDLIQYVPVDRSSILMDLDTPEDYASQAPSSKIK